MSIFERDYFRSGHDAWKNRRRRWDFGGRLTTAVKWFLIIEGGLFAVSFVLLANRVDDYYESLTAVIGLNPAAVRGGSVWQFLTYFFLHPLSPGKLGIVAANLFAFFFLGKRVERELGTRRFIGMLFASAVLAAFAYVLSDIASPGRGTHLGAAAPAAAVTAAFFMTRKTDFHFYVLPVNGKILASIAAVFILLSNWYPPSGFDPYTMAFPVVGAVVGAVYFFIAAKLGSKVSGVTLKVIDGGRSDRSRRTGLGRGERAEDVEFYRKVDAALDKINREGVDALTSSEKELLDEASRRSKRDR